MPKTINTIYPERVSEQILDFLKIPHNLTPLEPFFIGEKYGSSCLEVVPDFVPDPTFLAQTLINVRMDYHFDEDNLLALANNRKISIIFDQPINLDKLKLIKGSLNHFFYFVTLDTDAQYLKDLQKLGIPITLLYKGVEEISQIRLHLLDMIVEEVEEKTLEKLDNKEKVDDSTYYKSAKALFSNGKEYSSKAAWKRGVPAKQEQKIINCPEFWEEIDHFKLYNKNG